MEIITKLQYNLIKNIFIGGSAMYIIVNDIFIDVDGESVKFGIMAENDKTGEIVYLTNKEVEELKKEAKFSCSFKDEGWRYGSYSQIFGIEGNKVSGKIPKRYVEQLEYMGYDISKLEYELKE